MISIKGGFWWQKPPWWHDLSSTSHSNGAFSPLSLLDSVQVLLGFPFPRSRLSRSHSAREKLEGALKWPARKEKKEHCSQKLCVRDSRLTCGVRTALRGSTVRSLWRSKCVLCIPPRWEPASQRASRQLPQTCHWRRFMLSSKMAARQPTDSTALWNLNSSAH